MNIHEMNGCAPAPLAHYLKALGILRLVSEQADPEARGWWNGDQFRLATFLSKEKLEDFFLNQYTPSPIIAPWNRGSGFYDQNDPSLSTFKSTDAERAAHIKSGIESAFKLLKEISDADKKVREIKNETKLTKDDKDLIRRELRIPQNSKIKLTLAQKKELKEREKSLLMAKKKHGSGENYKKKLAFAERRFKQCKSELIPRIRLAWRGALREWMDVAIVLSENGSPSYPSLLGTGGADGHLDFTNNFLQRLSDMFDFSTPEGKPRQNAAAWFNNAIWGTPITDFQHGKAIGQFNPGMAGGANAGNGPSASSLLNPADFILMMEGTILFSSHVTRRSQSDRQPRTAIPFAMNAQGAGYTSASVDDESSRGEQWMPLWSHPLKLNELHHLLAEGRAQIGPITANEPLNMARAVMRLGSARGINAFQRYGYIERQGRSNLAVPIGRFAVPDRVSPHLICLDDLDAWHGRLRRQARSKTAPARLQMVERQLSDSLFAVTRHPDEPARWQSVLIAMANVEAVLRTGSGYRARPIPPLCPEWVRAADDGCPEIRLALSCALQWPSPRRHWLPLRKNQFAVSAGTAHSHLDKLPDVVMTGRDGVEDAISVLRRRLVEIDTNNGRVLNLHSAKKASAYPEDLGKLLAGEVDPNRVMQLARALMALDRLKWSETPCPPKHPNKYEYRPDDIWLSIRLSMLPFPLPPDNRQVPTDPAILRRLESGDVPSSLEISRQRLRAAGIQTTLRSAIVPLHTARLWAAALIFPISKNTALAFLRRLDSNSLI